MSQNEVPTPPNLKDVEPCSDAYQTPRSERNGTQLNSDFAPKSGAAAMPQGLKPGPKDSPVQVRNAGEDAEAETPKKWDDLDEAVDESFPASDPSAKY